jgi:hypothetical protein
MRSNNIFKFILMKICLELTPVKYLHKENKLVFASNSKFEISLWNISAEFSFRITWLKHLPKYRNYFFFSISCTST